MRNIVNLTEKPQPSPEDCPGNHVSQEVALQLTETRRHGDDEQTEMKNFYGSFEAGSQSFTGVEDEPGLDCQYGQVEDAGQHHQGGGDRPRLDCDGGGEGESEEKVESEQEEDVVLVLAPLQVGGTQVYRVV